MVQLSEEELRQLTETWKDMQETVRQLRTSHKNSAQVHISAGGVGIWLATTACLVMLAMMLVGSVWISREFNRQDASDKEQNEQISDTKDYIQAIYSVAPQLKPPEKDQEKREKSP